MSEHRLTPTAYGSRFAFRMLFTLAPTIEAVLLVWLVGAINLFWSSAFGIGGYLIEWYVPHGTPSSWHLFGLFGWPILMWMGLHWLSGWVWRLPSQPRSAVLAVYLASLCVVVPMDGVIYGPFQYEALPLFIRLWTY